MSAREIATNLKFDFDAWDIYFDRKWNEYFIKYKSSWKKKYTRPFEAAILGGKKYRRWSIFLFKMINGHFACALIFEKIYLKATSYFNR